MDAGETTDTVSYKSPYYKQLDDAVTQKHGLPAGLLPAIRTRGERSNSDQVSDAGAKTVYQIIPATRDSALTKWGIDAYLSPQNAAEVAGRLLKESLERNSGMAPLAVAEYIGGTDPKNWGPNTRDYVKRVTGESITTRGADPRQSTYDRLRAKEIDAATPSIARVVAAYKSGAMAPEDKAAFEADIASGAVILPKGSGITVAKAATAPTANKDGVAMAPQGVLDAYQGQQMTPAEAHEFETDVAEKRIAVPDGFKVGAPAGIAARASDAVMESVSGAKRATPETDRLPDWLGMPELSQMTAAGMKAGIGTMFAGPAEAVKVIQANFPGTKVTQDSKGNYLLTSSVDGKEYAIKPGFQWGDVPRALGAIAAFTPAGRATTIAGGAAGAGATEAVIQASQAATGGDFDAKDVAMAAAAGAAVPLAARVVEAAKPAVVQAVDAVKSRLPTARAAAGEPPPPVPPGAPGAPAVTPNAPAAAAVPEGQPAPPPTPETGGVRELSTKGLEVEMPHLRIADENLAKGKPSVTPDAPVQVEYNIDTGVYSLLDGHHRYLAKRGGSLAEAVAQADKGVFPNIKADVALVKNDIRDGVTQSRPLTSDERAAYLAKNAPPSAPADAPAAAAAPRMTAEELAAATRKAAEGGLGSKAATAKVAAETAPDAATVKAMDELGFQYQPDHVTTNQAYRELAQAVKSVPGSQTRAAELEILQHNAQKADELITTLGGSRDLSTLNADVKTKLGQIHADLKKGAKEIYDEIEKKIPPTTPAQMTNTLETIYARAEKLGGVRFLTTGERKIIADLSTEEGRFPTYALLDQTRKDIGAAKRGANEAFGTRDTKILGDLEAALRKDQGAVAASKGAGELWEAANAATRAYKGVQDDLVDLFGKTLEGSIVGDLKNAVGKLTTGDTSQFVKMIKAIPEAMRREVVASGLSSAFGVNARNGSINFNSYTKWFEGLEKNKVARDALFANLPPDAVRQLTNLYKASKGISAATRERITTGRIQAVEAELLKGDSLMGRIFDIAKKSGAAEAVTSSLGLPGAGVAAGIASALTRGKTSAMKAADALINSPEFIAAARNASKQNVAKLAKSKPFSAFIRAAGNPREMRDREKWVTLALQANKDKK